MNRPGCGQRAGYDRHVDNDETLCPPCELWLRVMALELERLRPVPRPHGHTKAVIEPNQARANLALLVATLGED